MEIMMVLGRMATTKTMDFLFQMTTKCSDLFAASGFDEKDGT
jgi:hypothetical protein